MSDRYQAICALLDDPLNVACFFREFQRRKLQNIKLLPPPIPRKGGGWVFPTFRYAMSEPIPSEVDFNHELDSAFEIYSDGKGWFVLSVVGDEELGPFDSDREALKQARGLAKGEGYIELAQMPWDNQDVAEKAL